MTSINLYEAYAAVYDEDLRQELLVVEDDLSFVDDLSDNELVQIMEEIFVEGEFDLNECVELLDSELLSEETEMERMNRLQNKATRERKSAAATAKRMKSAERERVGRKHAVKRLQVAATRAGRNVKSDVKTKGAGAASAAMGGAAEAGRKLSSAKEKVKGFLKGVRDTVSGAARKVYDRVSGREAKRTALKRAAYNRRKEQRAAKAKKAVSEPKEKTGKNAANATTTYRGLGVGRKEQASSGGIQSKTASGSGSGPSSAGRALPPKGAGSRTPGGRLRRDSDRVFAMSRAASRGRKALAREDYEMIADMIAEQLVSEGYVYDIIEAYDIILEMDDINIDEIVESVENYLTEGYDEYEVEEEFLDVYDVVLEHLLDEGYADSIESAESIMANMSEEWRDEIIDEAADNVIMTVRSPSGQERSKIRKGASRPSDYHRHETPEQIARRRFSQQLADRGKEREERMRAGRLTVATKRGIEAATNRSNDGIGGNKFVQGSSLRAKERDDQPTDYRARRRRASGR